MTLQLYALNDGKIISSTWNPGDAISNQSIWLDLLSPTHEEEKAAENYIGLDIPTRDEMREIEISNALYSEDGRLFMTAQLLTKFDTDEPQNEAVTFILCNKRLITVRYCDPVPFRSFPQRLVREGGDHTTANWIFSGLMEAIVARAADILEAITQKSEQIAKGVFVTETPDGKKPKVDYDRVLIRIGKSGDIIGKARESLTTLFRLVAYAQQNIRDCTPELKEALIAHNKDITALTDHAMYIGNKLQFLLDATLGMISINQNNIIKIFSIAAVVFLPPTLVASIFGMNFHYMPELDWHFGYPLALVAMALSGVLPIWYFRHKKWL